jgi:ABC-2 type transport system permease protein
MMPAMLNEPSGTVSQVLSLIPFTSPVAMMLRIPFGVPLTQVYWSVALLVASFPLCTWLAARLYRGSILRYNRLASFRAKYKKKK